MQEWYHWWGWRQRRMTKKQLQEMIHNMKKSEVISEKAKKYHKKEEIEAEEILKKLDITNI